jgi:amidase
MSSTEERDGTAIAGAIRRGETTAVAALESALARANEVEALGAIRARADDLAFEAARAIDRAVADGTLPNHSVFAGVPFLMKDLGVRVRGLPTVSGSRAMLRRVTPATADDFLTARFRKSGLVIFGMTTVPEFGGNLICEPAIGPLCRNPLDPRRAPGGSSGGAASAVASAIVPFAHANDAAGSIRVPAACCGLVGLKPSRGATPAGPDFDNYCAGIVANLMLSRSLRDTAAALAAISGNARWPTPDPHLGRLQEFDAAPEPLRIAIVFDLPDGLPFDSRRRAAIVHAGDVFRQAGHAVSPLDPDRLTPLLKIRRKRPDDLVRQPRTHARCA